MQELFEIKWPEVDKEFSTNTCTLFPSKAGKGEEDIGKNYQNYLNFMGFIPLSPLHEHICLPGDGIKRKISFKTPKIGILLCLLGVVYKTLLIFY